MNKTPSVPPAQDSGSGVRESTPADVLSAPSYSVRGLPFGVWVVAGLVVLAIFAGLILTSRGHTRPSANDALPLDPYAASLPISDAVMSESESISGGKSTFIDGHIRNSGPKVVTGATVQVFFRNDEGMPPHMETLPLPVVRTREPYLDTQSIAASPLQPGDDREFRLIFETLPGNWNTRLPEIHIVHVTTR